MHQNKNTVISVVATLYNSSKYIEEFYRRIQSTLKSVTNQYEIILVDDGSPDDSLQIAKRIQSTDKTVKIIELSRNFGHHRAMMTGLAHTDGDLIFLIDSDLEEEPELLSTFLEEIRKNPSIDMVYGVQRKRKGGIFERWSGTLFYKFLNVLSGVPIPANVTTARLMTRRYLDSLLLHREKEMVLLGLTALTGYSQKEVTINKGHKGTTDYTLSKKIDLAINFLSSVSSKPLLYIFYIGAAITFISLGAVLFLFLNKLFFDRAPLGWTSLVVSLWLLGGMIIFFQGIIGIYLSKIFIEVKNRPLTIIKEIHDSKEQ